MLPSHGRSRRFNPYRAHQFNSSPTKISTSAYAVAVVVALVGAGAAYKREAAYEDLILPPLVAWQGVDWYVAVEAAASFGREAGSGSPS